MKAPARAPPEHLEQTKPTQASGAQLPAEGFVRLPQVLAVLPVSPAHFWDGVRQGIFAAGLSLSPKVTVWAVEDVRRMIEHYKERSGWKPWEPPPKTAMRDPSAQ
jgi:prophage regulatory protein